MMHVTGGVAMRVAERLSLGTGRAGTVGIDRFLYHFFRYPGLGILQ